MTRRFLLAPLFASAIAALDSARSPRRRFPTRFRKKTPPSSRTQSQVVQNNCTACHSADYIQTQPRGPNSRRISGSRGDEK